MTTHQKCSGFVALTPIDIPHVAHIPRGATTTRTVFQDVVPVSRGSITLITTPVDPNRPKTKLPSNITQNPLDWSPSLRCERRTSDLPVSHRFRTVSLNGSGYEPTLGTSGRTTDSVSQPRETIPVVGPSSYHGLAMTRATVQPD